MRKFLDERSNSVFKDGSRIVDMLTVGRVSHNFGVKVKIVRFIGVEMTAAASKKIFRHGRCLEFEEKRRTPEVLHKAFGPRVIHSVQVEIVVPEGGIAIEGVTRGRLGHASAE